MSAEKLLGDVLRGKTAVTVTLILLAIVYRVFSGSKKVVVDNRKTFVTSSNDPVSRFYNPAVSGFKGNPLNYYIYNLSLKNPETYKEEVYVPIMGFLDKVPGQDKLETVCALHEKKYLNGVWLPKNQSGNNWTNDAINALPTLPGMVADVSSYENPGFDITNYRWVEGNYGFSGGSGPLMTDPDGRHYTFNTISMPGI